MKKSLIVFGLSIFTMPVVAGEWEYDYGLTANSFYGYSGYAEKYHQIYKHHHTPSSAEITSSVGYRFDSETALTFGLDAQIAGGKEVEDYNQGEWGENIYVTAATKYGELTAGQVYNAAYQMAVGAPSVGAFRVNNSPITDFIANPNWQRHSRTASYRTLNSTYLNTDADAPKISYVTPEIYHTKAAFSYAPEGYSKAGLVNKHSRYDNRSSYALGLYNDLDLDWVEVESSLGYAYNRKNNQEVSAGLSLYRKGWTLGGSYRRSYMSSRDYEMNLQSSDETPAYFDGYRQGQAYNIGLSYEIGPFKTGVSYFYAKARKTANKDKIVTWANRFAFNKYVAIYAATAYGKYKGNRDTATDSNEGYALISGLEITF